MKPIIYCDTVLKDIEEFPEKARQRIAQLLSMLSEGLDLQPNDFKYMQTVGTGVYELRLKVDRQQFRTFYIAKFEEAIYVLHAFTKKTAQTAPKDIKKGSDRYKALLNYRKRKNYD